MEAYVRAHSEKDKNTSQTPKLPYHLKKSTYINDKNDKTNPQPSTVAPPSITYMLLPLLLKRKLNKKSTPKIMYCRLISETRPLRNRTKWPEGDYIKRGNAKKVQNRSKAGGFACA